ncbi:MAG: 30S ribosomal protein S12 methylthiotransferase RimO [Eggerthellaceae bacterium]|nr:30S ribosomal protein S12 methylthiotransferase RimO [Eggerthellaceae bacterium]
MTQTGPEQRSVAFITMGCAKNEVDSDHMGERLQRAGYSISDDPETADVVVVNTCSFIQAATEESIDAILEVAGYASVSEGRAHLVVAGCMPARYGDDLAQELPEAGAFVPCADETTIVNVVDELLGIERMPGSDIAVEARPVVDRVSAYVKISDGCDRFCAYCTIPYIRGRYHSFELSDIMSEIERVASRGAREIVLIAQDTGRWGTDLNVPSSLAELVGTVADAYPNLWFRVMYIQPEGITDELIKAVSEHANVCKYFDIPFQHSNGRILKSMNRSGSGSEYLDLLARIRAAIPDVTLRTTLIAGYPGETEDDFEELKDFVEAADLDYIGVFPYSREEGTRAYDLDGQIDEDEKLSRAQEIRDLADAVCAPRIASRVGREVDVLVCGQEEDGQLFGRAMCQAPDVDGVTYIDAGEPGEVVRVRLEDSLMYELEGTVVS